MTARGTALLFFAVALLLSGRAVAQAPEAPPPDAASHYDQGVTFFKAGDMAMALAEFEAAYAAAPRFEPLYNIAVTHKKLNHRAPAYTAFLRYLSEGGDRVPAARRDEVDDELRTLARQIAHVDVLVESPPAQIEIDGTVIGQTPLPTQHLEPGRHEFRASRSGCAQALDVRTVLAGEAVFLPLKPVPLPPPEPEPPARHQLSVDTSPTGASLEVNYQPVGKAPWSRELKPGWYVVNAELDGYLPQSAKLQLQDEPRSVRLTLEKKHWYQQWYVWTAAAGVVAAAAATTATVLVVRSRPDVSVHVP
jgi:hypothetical protein